MTPDACPAGPNCKAAKANERMARLTEARRDEPALAAPGCRACWDQILIAPEEHALALNVIDAARALVSMPWGTHIGATIPNLAVLARAVQDLDGDAS